MCPSALMALPVDWGGGLAYWRAKGRGKAGVPTPPWEPTCPSLFPAVPTSEVSSVRLYP